jgi:hypothetical protein
VAQSVCEREISGVKHLFREEKVILSFFFRERGGAKHLIEEKEVALSICLKRKR